MAGLLILTLVNSCQDDDNDAGGDGLMPNNSFLWQGEDYPTPAGFLGSGVRPGTQPSGSYGFDLYLVSEGLTYSSTDANFRGRGDVIILLLNSADSTALSAGAYTFPEVGEEDATFTITENSRALIDFDVASQSGFQSDLVSGEVVVSPIPGGARITYAMVMANGDEVTGNYSGPLPPLQ